MCPNCEHQIAWYDNIPLISYLILGGRCRNCKKKISIRYPTIELTSGVGFSLIYYFSTLQGSTFQGGYGIFQLILMLAIFVVLFTILVIDLEHQIIPDSLVFAGIFIVLIYSQFITHQSIFTTLFPGFLAASFLMLIHLLTKGRGMGLGDVKFAVFGGMLVGLVNLPTWLFLSFLTGGIVGTILILLGKAKMKTKIAFGPFLIAGIALTFIFGDKISILFGCI